MGVYQYTSEHHSTVYGGGTAEMVRACKKNVHQQNRPEVAGMEAKYRPAGPEAGQGNDGQTMSRRLMKSEDLH